uniref:hypothetical protein n=1 Tax=Agathobacter sp. TaxID=2021311 RepID=UPI003FEFDB38
MERLTERNPLWIDDEMWERACEPDCEEIDAVYRKLKEYEDAEEQGLLLRLPISKDTPVYSIEYCCGRDKNNRIGMCVRGFCKDCDDKAYYIRECTAEHCSICEIQKSVFFTPREAETKLAEMSCFQNGNS